MRTIGRGYVREIITVRQQGLTTRGGYNTMESIEFFKKLRDVSGAIVIAMESDDVEAIESAMGRFVILMMQADALK